MTPRVLDIHGSTTAYRHRWRQWKNPLYAETAKNLAPDLWGELYFFIGISDSQIGKHKESYENFRKAYANGYDKKEAYDYAISEAYQIDDKEGMAEVAASDHTRTADPFEREHPCHCRYNNCQRYCTEWGYVARRHYFKRTLSRLYYIQSP